VELIVVKLAICVKLLPLARINYERIPIIKAVN